MTDQAYEKTQKMIQEHQMDVCEVGLLMCVSEKGDLETWSRDLYKSDWFKKASEYADENLDAWWILSAEHGLVHISDIIKPYEKRLSTKKAPKAEWAEKVKKQWDQMLCDEGLENTEIQVTFLAGKDYRENLDSMLTEEELQTFSPLKGMGIGDQKSWFCKNTYGTYQAHKN